MRRILKGIGIGLGALIALLVVLSAGLLIYGQVMFHRGYPKRPLYSIVADTSPAGIARGEYLVRDVVGCQGCHGPAVAEGERADRNASLSGRSEPINFGPISGNFSTPNLTSDLETGLGGWTDAEIARAIREGLDKSGTALAVMPAGMLHSLSDADVAAIVGYLRSLEPVHNPVPPFEVNSVGKTVLALGIFEKPNPTGPISAAKVDPAPGSAEHGQYLVSIMGCARCHGPAFSGGSLPGAPADAPQAANLTPAGELAGWSEADFLTAITTGQTPSGHTLSDVMPWKDYARVQEVDLKAIFTYLRTLPPAETKK